MTHIGTIFRKVRFGLNLKQTEVARQAGLKRDYYNRIEMGKLQNPTLSTAKKIAKALGIPLSDIIDMWEETDER